MKNNFYLKVSFVAIIIILLFALIINTSVFLFNWGLEKAKEDIIGEYMKCEIRYKDAYYKGNCKDEIFEGVGLVIEADTRIELLKFCISYPYAYRYGICNDRMEMD